MNSPPAGTEPRLSVLLSRARGEYIEMPGLCLEASQAARLWALDSATSQRVLDGLVASGFLRRTLDGRYVRPSERRQ